MFIIAINDMCERPWGRRGVVSKLAKDESDNNNDHLWHKKRKTDKEIAVRV